MTGKEYLEQAERISRLIDQKERELKTLDGASIHDERLAEVRAEIAYELENLLIKRYEVFRQIQGLSDINHIDVLYRRYMQSEDMKHIASEMKRSLSFVHHIHAAAVREFEKRYRDELKPLIEGSMLYSGSKKTKNGF